jgi:hypothetical protein
MKDFLKQFEATHWMDSVKAVDNPLEDDIINLKIKESPMSFTIDQLKSFKQTLTLMNGGNIDPLKDEVLTRMANLWRTRTVRFTNEVQTIDETVNALVKYRNDWSPCGCLGPQDGWQWCPCELWAKMELYKMDIAIHILETHKEVTTIEELREIRKLVYPAE